MFSSFGTTQCFPGFCALSGHLQSCRSRTRSTIASLFSPWAAIRPIPSLDSPRFDIVTARNSCVGGLRNMEYTRQFAMYLSLRHPRKSQLVQKPCLIFVNSSSRRQKFPHFCAVSHDFCDISLQQNLPKAILVPKKARCGVLTNRVFRTFPIEAP